MTNTLKRLTNEEQEKLLTILQKRFEKNMHRHEGMLWDEVVNKLLDQPEKLWTISEMERTGGEPDIVILDEHQDDIFFLIALQKVQRDEEVFVMIAKR